MIDRVAGMMNAAPTPMSARVPINIVADDANADSTEPIPKIPSPSARHR